MTPVRPLRLASPHRRLPALREAALYRDSALRGNQVQAQGLMQEAMQRGFSLTEASVRMVQPAMIEVGRMWQHNRITVARGHVATAISQNVLARAYLEARFAPPLGRKALFAGAPGNQHDLGLRILADAFETHGWTTIELGASVPPGELIARVDAEMPQLVCISVSLPEQADAARDSIARLRAELGARCPAIWVGGQATLAGKRDRLVAQADGWAADAMHALQQLQA